MTKKVCLIFIVLVSILSISCQKQIDNSADISILKSAISSLQKTTDSLAKALASTNANVSSLSLKVDSIKNQIVIIQTQISLLNNQLTIANTNITLINAQIVTLNQQYLSLLAQLNAILVQLTITPSTLVNGLIAYYPFSGNAYDSSGNGYNGTVNGAVLTSDRFGAKNSAYSFDGISNFIETADIDLFNTATISAWVQPSGTLGSIVSKYGSQNESYELIYNNSTHGLYGHVGVVTNANNNIYSNFNLSINRWQHCVIILNNGLAQIFVDANLVYTQNGVNPTFQNNDNVLIGKSVWGGNLFSGKIDDIRIYNRTLNQAEINYLATH